MEKKPNIKKKNVKADIAFYSIITLMILISILYGIKVYLSYVEESEKKILALTDVNYIAEAPEIMNNGFNRLNIKKELTNYIKKKKKISSLTYQIPDEEFSLELAININDGKLSLNIDKIIDEKHQVFARMHLENIEEIEYKTGNSNETTVINFITDSSHEYFAITDNNYYFLGSDIKTLNYMNNHFYYMTYNPNYKSLEDAKECNKEVKNDIDGFNMSDYYYRYGKINFLPDFYQKLPSKTYTVEDKCNELKEQE